jgi:hypothetical protein
MHPDGGSHALLYENTFRFYMPGKWLWYALGDTVSGLILANGVRIAVSRKGAKTEAVQGLSRSGPGKRSPYRACFRSEKLRDRGGVRPHKWTPGWGNVVLPCTFRGYPPPKKFSGLHIFSGFFSCDISIYPHPAIFPDDGILIFRICGQSGVAARRSCSRTHAYPVTGMAEKRKKAEAGDPAG